MIYWSEPFELCWVALKDFLTPNVTSLWIAQDPFVSSAIDTALSDHSSHSPLHLGILQGILIPDMRSASGDVDLLVGAANQEAQVCRRPCEAITSW